MTQKNKSGDVIDFDPDFSKKRRLENIVELSAGEQSQNDGAVSGDYDAKDVEAKKMSGMDLKSTGKYLLGQLASDIEASIIPNLDDANYKIVCEVASSVTKDPVYAKAVALAGYFFCEELLGNNLKEKTK